jgi:hypothetical protein
MKNRPLSRLDILSPKTIKVVEKTVKAWNNQTVCLRELSASDVLTFNERVEELKKGGTEISTKNSFEISLKLLTLTVCDQDGVLLFTDEDIVELSKQSIAAMTELIGYAMEASGISPQAVAEAQDKLKNAPTAS